MRLFRSFVLVYLPVSLLAHMLLDSHYSKLTAVVTVKGNSVSVPRPGDEMQDKEFSHRTFQFSADIVQREYFPWSTAILVSLKDDTIWQSRDEGHSWRQIFPSIKCLAFYMHPYAPARAYIITDTDRIYSTTDAGRTWIPYRTPTRANTFGLQALRFHPESDKLLWIGDRDCHAEAQYTRDNGRRWFFVDNYVGNCAWGAEFKLSADPTKIVCQSFRDKTGAQRFFGEDNPLKLVEGTAFFTRKRELFEQADWFTKLAEFSLVAQREADGHSLRLHISLDGEQFVKAVFPRPLIPDVHGITLLESYIRSLFVHSATSESPYWGSLLKSNSNGTFFSVSAEYVNGEARSAVDFEKMVPYGLEGIALINIVANPNEAVISGQKALQTRITFNDVSPLAPPQVDSNNNKYAACVGTGCALHLHCHSRSTNPVAPWLAFIHWHADVAGVIIGVGSVGPALVPYNSGKSATFLSRDAGLTWAEVRKGSHVWAFAPGPVLAMARDDAPTDRLLFSTDLGLSWSEYRFTEVEGMKMRVREILPSTADNTIRPLNRWSFLLVGKVPRTAGDTFVAVDLTGLASSECKLDYENPTKRDFEPWIPTDGGEEGCLFGRQMLYYRPRRNTTCMDGIRFGHQIIKNCTCTRASDYECDLGYMKNDADECVRTPGIPWSLYDGSDECRTQNREGVWSEPPAYRKISFSSCEGGYRPAFPARHACPTPQPDRIGNTVWLVVFTLLVLFMVGIAAAVCRRYARKEAKGELGSIRLSEDGPAFAGGGSLSSDAPSDVPTPPSADRPWFAIRGFRWVKSRLGLTRQEGITLEGDEDAQLLHLEVESQS